MAVAKKVGTKSTEVVKNEMFRSNTKAKAEKKLPIGRLNVLLGVGGSIELFSNTNYVKTDGTRLLLRGFDNNDEEYQLTCNVSISDSIRNAESEEEFDELLDSAVLADVYHSEVQAKDRRSGALLFDEETEEPIMQDVYFLGSDYNEVDVKGTKKVIEVIAPAPVKEKTQFSWERLSAQ